MYSILLVEDEEPVRRAIKECIPWEEYGFTLAQEASNGLEALEVLDEKIPDVIITDIKMPYLDGIGLIEKIRGEYSTTADIIILSGYDEFVYAQEAVRLKVSEYVLKPIGVQSIKELLERTKKRLDKNREKVQKAFEGLSDDTFTKAMNLYRERYLSSLVSSKRYLTESEIIAEAKKFNLDLTGSLYAVAVLDLNHDFVLSPTLESIIDDTFNLSDNKPIVFQLYNQLVLLFISKMDSSFSSLFKKQLFRSLTILKNSIRVYTKEKIEIGAGKLVSSLEQLRESYIDATTAVNLSLVYRDQYIVTTSDVENIESERSSKSLDELRNEFSIAIKSGTEGDVIDIVTTAFEKLTDLSSIETMLLHLASMLSEILDSYSKSLSELTDQELFSLLSRARSRASATSIATELALNAHTLINGTRENSRVRFIERAKKLIKKHYADPGFGLEQLCDEISVSPGYFSTTFKKETGYSFVQYLTQIRINKAKEMLKNSNAKSYEIAEQLGFSEPNYFSFTFKRSVGLSPSQYRNSIKNEKEE